jgi:hypothetical protein
MFNRLSIVTDQIVFLKNQTFYVLVHRFVTGLYKFYGPSIILNQDLCMMALGLFLFQLMLQFHLIIPYLVFDIMFKRLS